MEGVGERVMERFKLAKVSILTAVNIKKPF
jgi:hypothetical protein